MEELKIYKFQAKQIDNTLRLVTRVLSSHNKETSLDREIMKSSETIKSILDETIILRNTEKDIAFLNEIKQHALKAFDDKDINSKEMLFQMINDWIDELSETIK
jgi:hypothetical protein